MNRFDEISALLQKGRPRELSALVQEELADGTSANDILTKALIPGMSAVGERFKKNEIFVPEVLITWNRSARRSSAPSRAICTISAKTSSK